MPPCFIIVCQNTAISKLVYDFISGFHRKNDDGTTTLENGRLPRFRNFDETTGNPLPRPNTLLIDSEQLEAGDALEMFSPTLCWCNVRQSYNRRDYGTSFTRMRPHDSGSASSDTT